METSAERLRRYLDEKVVTAAEFDALWLNEIKQLSLRQIALGLSISVSTVRDRLARGRSKISRAERWSA